jgi:hypothetical protein
VNWWNLSLAQPGSFLFGLDLLLVYTSKPLDSCSFTKLGLFSPLLVSGHFVLLHGAVTFKFPWPWLTLSNNFILTQ